MDKTYTVRLKGYGKVTGTIEELGKMADALMAVSSSYANKVDSYIEQKEAFLQTYYWNRYVEASDGWIRLTDLIRDAKKEVPE